MTRETKAGLLMIVMLVGVFGFMVYKRLHHPAQALAQQNADPVADEAVEDVAPVSPSVVGNGAAFTETPRIIPAVASEPVPIPDEPIRVVHNPEAPPSRPRESDPFGHDFRPPNHRKPSLPTSIPDDREFSRPTKEAETAMANAETHGSESPASNEIDPFAVNESRTTKESEPAEPTAAVATAEPDEQDPFSAPVTHSTPHKRHANPAELDSNPFSSSPPETAKELNRPPHMADTRHPSRPLPESVGSAANDPFEAPQEFQPSNASVPVLAAPAAQSAPSFEPVRPVPDPGFSPETRVAQNDEWPRDRANLSKKSLPRIDPFSEPRREEVRSANAHSGEAKSKRVDDRFGGFRPAGAGQIPATEFSDDSSLTTPDIAVGSAASSSRRPAPISEIDEDFAPRASATATVGGDTYQVEPNENFWTISRKRYGTGRYFMALAQHNSKVIPDPKRMRPGVTISTPTAEALEQAYPDFIPKAGPDSSTQPAPSSTAQFHGGEDGFAPHASSSAFVPGDTHRVEPNEDFWTISRKRYGTGRYFMALARHNSQIIPDPKRMRPGVTIATPSAESLEQTYPDFIPKAAHVGAIQTASSSGEQFRGAAEDAGFFLASDGSPMYRIASEDTLSGIAQRHLGRSSRWVQIFEMNHDVLKDGNTLKVGALLRLPADASRVEVVGGSRQYR